jgi:hypothetical protein
LIDGDDDGIVSVASTRLAGAADYLYVESLHLALNRNETVHASAVRFLQTGKFRAEGDPQPIPGEAKKQNEK